MAEMFVTPVTLPVASRMNTWQEFRSPAVKDQLGDPVDLSAWTTLTSTLIAASGAVKGSTTFGNATGGADGVIRLVVASDQYTQLQPGAATLIITGINVAGDDPQLLATGTAQIGA